ncbi:uncharacterized protein LOC130815891 isoform X3 [Amaranthus tricolor]|uniref:uncharacterized protein LOC130815891 isoform X3 n=1 Tax=Amaranthus tricolor TaxID=29722 RepID=UPI00258C9BDA|nr:uncharacterized protein LOC130815891 isoform X3 [Amaranthus tricolor]
MTWPLVCLHMLLLMTTTPKYMVLNVWQLLMNLRDDGEYEEVFEDVREECEKYGGLLSVIILRPIMEGNLIPGGWKG